MATASKRGAAGSGSPACSATVWTRSDRLAAQSASSPAGAWLPCSTTNSLRGPGRSPAPVNSAPARRAPCLSHRPGPSQRDVAVAPAALRRVRDGLDDRFPGLRRLDDLVDHTQVLG